MATYNLGKSVTQISKNVKQDELYLDTTKAKSLVADMEKQYKIMINSANNIAKYATQLTAAKAVTGEYDTAMRTLASTSKSRAKYAGERYKSLKTKFDASVKDYTIKLLDSRLDELEAKLKALEEAAKQ